MSRQFFFLLCITLLLTLPSRADEHTHHYEKGEDIIFWVNTVGPYNNRQETYAFYKLPYCRGQEVVEHHHETLGEVLQGMELINAGIGAKFQIPSFNVTLCDKVLDEKEVQLFREVIRENYWYHLFADDLPIWGFVGFTGEIRTSRDDTDPTYLYTHKEFSVSYNGDQIIEVNLTSSEPIRLPSSGGLSVRFSWSLKWSPTEKTFHKRFDKYLDQDFFEHKIHWFSVANSFVMVIFLVGLVSVILLRVLHRDYQRYNFRKTDALESNVDNGDEYGWKQVHADVFREPPLLSVLAAFVGTGWQLGILTLIIILFTIVGDLYTERSTILTASVFCYALTAFFAGFFSSSYYSKYDGKHWLNVMFLTTTIWPAIASIVTLLNNFVAMYYESSRAIHFGTLVAIICIWFFLIFPLTLLGTVIGRRWAGKPDFPCRVNPIPRAVPEKPWYFQSWIIVMLGGLLPFGSIFIEMYFIFSSFWAYKIYYVYGFMLLVFLILLVVSSCVAIVSVYLLLNSEEHEWHWLSFLSSGTTAFYVLLYSVYYFFARTKMTGFFQIFFYFSFTSVVCFGLFLTVGTCGLVAAELFIRKIYQNVKID